MPVFGSKPKLFFWLCFFHFFSFGFITAQEQNIQFENTNLVEAIQQIEKASNLVFNYAPDELEHYTVNGQLNLQNQDHFIKTLLYDTPFQFEQTDNTIIIFLPKKTTYQICGRILDATSQQTLPFANILLEGQARGTQSDEEGVFNLAFTAYKNQAITISYVAYNSTSYTAQDFPSQDCLTILIGPDENLFGEGIVVVDYILDGITEGESYTSTKMDYNQLSKNHSNIEHDILKTAQLIPGISSTDESATNIQIRGSTADQNLILWEGVPLYNPGHFFGMISAINPFVVDKVDIYKGVFDPSYDNRVGGIIDMSLSDSIAQELSGGLGLTMTEAHAYLEAPLLSNKLSLILSGRNTIGNLIPTPTLISYAYKVFQDTKVEDDVDTEEPDQFLNFYDWNAKLIFKPSSKWLLKASIFRSHNKFDYYAPIFEDEIETNDNVQFNASAMSASIRFSPSRRFNSQLTLSQSIYDNNYFFDIFTSEDSIQIEELLIFNDIIDQTISLSNDWMLSDSLQLTFGYAFNRKEVNFNYTFNSIFEPEFQDDNFTIGTFHNTFAAFQYQRKKLQFNGGFRITRYEETADWVFSPRLNAQLALNKTFKLKFSAGILQQYISQIKEFGENDLGINNPVWVLNRTESEDYQEAKKITFGLLYHKKGWLLDIEAYLNETEGISTLSPLFGKDIDVDDFSSGMSTAKGIDLLLKKHWSNYRFWLNYSLSQVDFYFPEINDFSFPGSNDQIHKLSFINSFNYKKWNFTLSYQFKSALPYSIPIAVNSFIDEEEEDTYYEIAYDALNQGRLNNYSRLDFGISHKSAFKSSRLKSEIALSFINILKRENIFSREYYLGDLEEDRIQPELFSVDKIMLDRTIQLLLRLYW